MAAPVERKVKAATTGATGGTLVSAIVAALLLKYVLPKDMDPVLQVEIVAAIPTVVAAVTTFLSGYYARHTSRSAPAAPAPPA